MNIKNRFKKWLKQHPSLVSDCHGSMALSIIFIFLFVIMVFIFAFAAPFLMTFTTSMYVAGEDVMDMGNDEAGNIQDTEMRTAIQDIFTETTSSFDEQISILGFFAQYGWLLIVFVVSFVIVMIGRQTVERGAVI